MFNFEVIIILYFVNIFGIKLSTYMEYCIIIVQNNISHQLILVTEKKLKDIGIYHFAIIRIDIDVAN
jgi:hypothetical protein